MPSCAVARLTAAAHPSRLAQRSPCVAAAMLRAPPASNVGLQRHTGFASIQPPSAQPCILAANNRWSAISTCRPQRKMKAAARRPRLCHAPSANALCAMRLPPGASRALRCNPLTLNRFLLNPGSLRTALASPGIREPSSRRRTAARGPTATLVDSSPRIRHCLIVALPRITAVSALARSDP